MATNLYETLGISKSATPEQVRKAYKKKALETHPDRLGPGVSSADKAQSEDFFRKVAWGGVPDTMAYAHSSF
ncbi:hypothetical protein C0989_001513 [Termitomyces sp. Mn162]|nr:hypothetical protein C0989_001513 [Termitomyces sp. Mn162]